MRSAREEASELLFALWSAPRELLPTLAAIPAPGKPRGSDTYPSCPTRLGPAGGLLRERRQIVQEPEPGGLQCPREDGRLDGGN